MRNFPNFPNQAQRPNPSDEYEDFYNENNQIPRFPMQRQGYPSENRGIRSKNEASETTVSENDTTSKPKSLDKIQNAKQIGAERAQTLWDLEYEKETQEDLEGDRGTGKKFALTDVIFHNTFQIPKILITAKIRVNDP
jgi:hypothetical protein